MKHKNQSRRSFVSTMAGTALGFTIVPRHVLGGPRFMAPSDTVNFAIVGAGAQGAGNTRAAIGYGQNLVAIVDVDMEAVNLRVGGTQGGGPGAAANAAPNPAAAIRATEAFAKATRYADFRVMLDRERNRIDGVIVPRLITCVRSSPTRRCRRERRSTWRSRSPGRFTKRAFSLRRRRARASRRRWAIRGTPWRGQNESGS